VSYYHVLVKFAGGSEPPECIFKDLTLAQLKKQFLRPYERGWKVLSGTRVFDVMAINWTQIVQTERPSELELREIREKSRKEIEDFNRDGSVVLISIGRGYADEDIVEAGKDVTTIYIKAPPGATSNLISALLNHQWVVTLLGGVIVAGLVAWLGWG